jgi:hypothetical protein
MSCAPPYSGELTFLTRCAIRTETLSAEDRSSTRRLKGHSVSLAALVADNLESLTLPAWSP